MIQAIGEEVMTGTPFVALEVIGTIAFAVSGFMAAGRARMDWLGAMVLALAVAVGGGTIRDVLLGQLPVAWLIGGWTVFVALGTSIALIFLVRIRPKVNLDTATPILIADAVGLASFVIIGTQIGLNANITPFFAVMLGVLTGVGGGVIRDILTGNKPMVLVGQIYAVAGIVGGALFVLMLEVGINTQVSIWVSVITIFLLRMIAIRKDWHLPRAIPSTAASNTDELNGKN